MQSCLHSCLGGWAPVPKAMQSIEPKVMKGTEPITQTPELSEQL